ncbi:C3H1-type domain-containing protein [Plasmodiophora brassicae]
MFSAPNIDEHLKHHTFGNLFVMHPAASPLVKAPQRLAVGPAIGQRSPVLGDVERQPWEATSSPPRLQIRVPLSPPQDDAPRRNPLFKTNFCREFSMTGSCPFQDKCHFAHGERELRPLPAGAVLAPATHRPSAVGALGDHVYKTELCTVFAREGSCRYGMRCHFAHGFQELRPRSATASSSGSSSKAARVGRCIQWDATRTCRFGPDCRFVHQQD